jgi:DNA-binding GntR family transcriptional regulator
MKEDVYLKIKAMIYNNELAPGQKLIYQALAKKLNLSMTPVIQALNRLEHSNLVRHEPNRGYFVGEMHETECRELYQAREALETYIIPFAIQKLEPSKNIPQPHR